MKPGWRFEALAPNWILWFLLSLVFWRLMLPLFVRLPFPFPSAVAIAVAIGFVDAIDNTLSLSRTLVFFPAFLFGYLYRQRILEGAQVARGGSAAVLALLAGASGLWVALGGGVLTLYGSTPYALQPYGLIPSAVLRLVVVCAGLVAALAFLSLLPRQANVLSALGRRTIPVYLMHGFLVLAFWVAVPTAVLPQFAVIALTGCLSILVAFGLASISEMPFITSRTKPWVVAVQQAKPAPREHGN
jgi:fucose 4-O-acetylase-like acetyltransferase